MIDHSPPTTDQDFDPEQFKPGSHGCHEALHTANLLADLVDERLCQHPALLLKPEWRSMAIKASDALSDLYQAIGQEHSRDPA